ncbi:tetratricopeptide repeat protein [Sphingobium cloacae]|uniref:Tetratricopeptide repeat protein n=1 Tax=Sphingobium cloacae TaxID=120107 RepID=A0A1E1F1J0_9SPHN|nr:tetratricopeptide repeat protein [Sphingobium cloacae]BAV64383.1 hypothetical protein SCLO_1013430 [Sphingobium cloacae]
MNRKRLFLLAGIAVLLLSVAALWQWRRHESDGTAPLSRGIAALVKGDARTARVELLNAIRADPASIPARIAQARALVDLGDGAGAQAEIERARVLGGKAGETRVLMAQALLLRGDADAALAEVESGDIPASFDAAAMRTTGNIQMARGDMAAAGAALDRARELAGKDPESWIDTARYRLALGDQAGAIVAADQAVGLAPQNVKALLLRGELTRSQYGLVAALPWFERALAINPDSVPVLEQYAATLADAGEARRMLSATRRLLALEPGHARAFFMQAVMAARAGRADLARSLLTRTQGRLDGDPATMLLRGVLHLEDGNATLALEALAPLVQQQPDNGVARTLLGRAYYLASDFPSAATVLAPLVAQRDADPYVLTLAARAQEAMGDRIMADDMLARALWPDRPSAAPFVNAQDAALAGSVPVNVASARENIPYIRALLSTGQAQQAVARARSLSEANPGAPDAYVIWGDALDAAGRPGEAVKAYEMAANLRFGRDVALRLAAALQRAGDPARSFQVVRLFLSQNPDDVLGLRLAASGYMAQGQWRDALRMLKAVAARIGPNDALLMADMARASLEAGDAGQARAYAAFAYRLMPESPITADAYGWTLFKTGTNRRAAVDLLEKAVALAPGHPQLRAHLEQAYTGSAKEGLAAR